MGLQYGFENIRNIRSGKGVYSGCDVTRSSANLIAMAAGRVKYGITAAVLAANEQTLNEGGIEKAVGAVTLSTTALPIGTHTLYLKAADDTLSFTPEAETPVSAGPIMTVNHAGLTNPSNVTLLGTPSIAVAKFAITGEAGTAATGTVTIAGTMETGNIVTVTVGGHAVAFTLTASETTATLAATAIKNALNADADVAGLVTATNASGVITLTAAKGSAGNSITLTTAVTGDTPTTTSVASVAALAGGINDIDATSISYNSRETIS